jgi:hypothetical protein
MKPANATAAIPFHIRDMVTSSQMNEAPDTARTITDQLHADQEVFLEQVRRENPSAVPRIG